ncbi:hypothetical protein [Congregicoccus parvus]|uniref:hypothetical protein n=1 Tax=Congregicoccus parvus TaxID=3081749 RepID=UPI003FA587D0
MNLFNQPYAYHAGLADQGFLYNDDGDLTLVWSAFDPDYDRIVGGALPWTAITDEKKRAFEDWLPPAPHGGRWRFGNPARCGRCKREISAPMGRNIYYVVYDGSLIADGISETAWQSLSEMKKGGESGSRE